jgi:hypothetical protein
MINIEKISALLILTRVHNVNVISLCHEHDYYYPTLYEWVYKVVSFL